MRWGPLAGTQAVRGPHPPRVTTTRFAYSIKALPAQPATGAPPGPPDPADEIQPPAHDDSRPWAGDAYDEGDESDPANAFAAFTGQDGEEAWLDRAPDGTLTGWVRDATGQVWRYSDDSAWALDVDGAQMQRTSATPDQNAPGADPAGAPVEQDAPPVGDEETDPYTDDSTAEDTADADPFADADEDPDDVSDDPGADDTGMEESPDEEDDEDDDAPFPGARKPKKKGGK